ncbi:MAG: hypothetical protein ACTSVU_07600 [Promethearchaeota archaeon]
MKIEKEHANNAMENFFLANFEIHKENFYQLASEAMKYSPSFSEIALITQICIHINQKIPISFKNLRILITLSLKRYKEQNGVLIEKISMLDSQSRTQALELLQKQILLILFSIILPKSEITNLNYVKEIVEDFFSQYL